MANIYREYASVDEKIAELEKRKSELKGEIVIDMMNKGLPEVETEDGIFGLRQIKSYTYTTKVEDMTKKLAEAKKKEVDTGKAKLKSDYTTVVFRQ